VFAASPKRASLHSGIVQHRLEGRTCYVTARLPLITSHA
jgi:hypothetical protein